MKTRYGKKREHKPNGRASAKKAYRAHLRACTESGVYFTPAGERTSRHSQSSAARDMIRGYGFPYA